LLGGTTAHAQSARGSGESLTLDTVTVTAERRETSLQETPISILAFSAENMETKGIEEVGDIAAFSPNLEIKGSRGGGNNSPTFQARGISGGGVGIYIDDIYVPTTNIAVLKTLDLQRIEVLRGPQGTNFGRNSTGGAVRIFTQQPSDEYEGYVKLTGGNFDRRDITAMVNIPLSDTFAIRAQGSYLNEDGYVERGTQMLGGSEDKIGRLQARWEASDQITATFGFLYSKSQSDGSPQDIITFDMRPGLEGVWEGNYGDWVSDFLEADGQAPIQPLDDPRFVRDDYTMPDFCFIDDADPDWDKACSLKNDTKYVQWDAKVEFRLSDSVSLTSTSAYSTVDVAGFSDWQEIGTEIRPNGENSDVFYQEFLLNAALFDGKVDLIAGGNYYHENAKTGGHVITRHGTSVASPVHVDPVTGVYGFANGDGDAGLFIRDDTRQVQKSDSLGGFASATWHLMDRLNLTGGLRFTYDKRDVARTEFASSNFVPVAGTDSTFVTTDHSWKQVDWRATVDYQISQDHMVYATASKAYKAGTFSFSIADNVPGPAQSGDFIKPIAPEKVKNLEVGARTEWLDGRIRFNPTVFYMMWSNRQAARQVSCLTDPDPAVSCPIGFRIEVADTGDVDLYGMEADTQILVSSRFSLNGGFGYTGYDLKDPAANNGPNLFPGPSKYSYNAGANYNLPVDNMGNVNFSLNWSWQSKQATYPSDGGDSGYELPSYGILNGRISWTTEDERITLSAFANNLLDKNYATYATAFGGGYWDVGGPANNGGGPRRAVNVVRARPISWGVTLQYNF
jgi:iron complex outermembrane receptor protein